MSRRLHAVFAALMLMQIACLTGAAVFGDSDVAVVFCATMLLVVAACWAVSA